jgi:RNA polymerase sigma-70 factor, ECF subfamily
VRNKEVGWQDRIQFFGYAAHVMRQLLAQHARTRQAAKRGGGHAKINLDERCFVSDEKASALIALDEALNQLEMLNPLQSKVVELRFYSGLSVEQTAEVLRISPRSVKRHWSTARLWLYSQLSSE